VRILLVTANYRPSVGGIERFVETLARGLVERGHEVTVATCRTRGAPAFEQDKGVRIVRIAASDAPRERLNVPYPLPAPRACLRTLRELVAWADVVHAQDALYLTTLAALTIARRRGVPSVLTQHVAFVPQQQAVLDLAQRIAIATLGRRAARLADVVASYNPSVAEWAQKTWDLYGVRLLPIGVATLADAADRSATRRELGVREDAFVALFTGRDVPKKRLDLFLGASDPAYVLLAVTDREDGGDAGAQLLPFTSPERFARLLAASDAFVLPSEAEGFPLALQEALVAGLPCVVTRHAGYERFLGDGEVVFVDADASAIREALLELSSDPHRRSTLAARARAAGRREFGLGPFVGAYEALYVELTERRSAQPPSDEFRPASDGAAETAR
jgi:glycosyltransferase involved in cell wall biosynthesis